MTNKKGREDLMKDREKRMPRTDGPEWVLRLSSIKKICLKTDKEKFVKNNYLLLLANGGSNYQPFESALLRIWQLALFLNNPNPKLKERKRKGYCQQ